LRKSERRSSLKMRRRKKRKRKRERMPRMPPRSRM